MAVDRRTVDLSAYPDLVRTQTRDISTADAAPPPAAGEAGRA